MIEDEIEVRELKTKDLFAVARILMNISDEAMDELSTLVTEEEIKKQEHQDKLREIQEKEEEGNLEDEERKELQKDLIRNRHEFGFQLAMDIMRLMLRHAEDDLVEWFADLAGMNKKEFLDTSIDAPLIVMEEIQEQQGFDNFLQKVSSLSKKMNMSGKGQSEN